MTPELKAFFKGRDPDHEQSEGVGKHNLEGMLYVYTITAEDEAPEELEVGKSYGVNVQSDYNWGADWDCVDHFWEVELVEVTTKVWQ